MALKFDAPVIPEELDPTDESFAHQFLERVAGDFRDPTFAEKGYPFGEHPAIKPHVWPKIVSVINQHPQIVAGVVQSQVLVVQRDLYNKPPRLTVGETISVRPKGRAP